MARLKFKSIKSLSNNEMAETIIRIEKKLFTLRFKKATTQSFKFHQIKHAKHRLAYLKTIFNRRLSLIQKKQDNKLPKLVKKNIKEL